MKTNMNGVDFLLGQLEKPTLGCQLWLDASAFRPPAYYLVLPQGLQQVNSQYHLDSMPLGWHTAKILYRKYKSKKEMTKVRAIQRYKLPNFDLINGNGIVERIQLLVDPVEIADYQDPVEIADYQNPVESKKKSRHTLECTNLCFTSSSEITLDFRKRTLINLYIIIRSCRAK